MDTIIKGNNIEIKQNKTNELREKKPEVLMEEE